MAKVFYYSKRYSQQGSPIRAVAYNDQFLISRAVAVAVPYKLGFRTYNATLNHLKDYTINEFKTKGTAFNFEGGLVGVGSTNDPLRVDKDWVDQQYIQATDWPFSQIGDPTDFTLPIAGSYFSVIYPYFNSIASPVTPYVEGNGDMRVLRTVTNGEQVAVVYSTWKNYKNTHMSTMVHSDIVYTPPGLAADEYIFHVYSATDTAMIAEIWSRTSGFRDYAFIILNGTMVSTYHRIIRMGRQPLTKMVGVSSVADQATWMTAIRACNLNATIVKDRRFIGMILPPVVMPGTTAAGDQSIVRFMFAEVSTTGEVTLMKNWTATNSEGSTNTRPNLAVLNRTLATSSDSDKDAVFLNLSPSSTLGFSLGHTPVVNRSYWGGTNSKGYVTVINHHYFVVGTSRMSDASKPSFYYDIDFENHRVMPSDHATNRRWAYSADSNNVTRLVVQHKSYLPGHYYADGRMVGLLNNGDRYGQNIPGNAGVGQVLYIFRGDVTSVDTGTDDRNFVNDNYGISRWMNVEPPTPAYSGCKATILYDKLRILNYGGEGSSWYGIGISLNLLSGDIGGKTYTLLDSDENKPAVAWKGYPLNNERTHASAQHPGMVAVRKNGTLYYHNACWVRGNTVNNTFDYAINSNSIGQYAFKVSQNVLDKMEAFGRALPLDSGYAERSGLYWSILPVYPGIGENYGFVRFLTSSKTADSTGADGWLRSVTSQIFQMVPITYVIDSLGVATVTDVDLSKLAPTPVVFSGVNQLGNENWHTWGSAAIDITATSYQLIHRGGVSGSYYQDGTTEPMWPQALEFNKSLARTKFFKNAAGTGYQAYPTISPTHGIGLIDVVGLGAFYAFRPYSFTTNTMGTAEQSYIVGTARPAAGFNLTINAPFNVYVEGRKYTVPVQTLNLTTITTAYRNAHFYCYIVIRDGVAKFHVSLDRLAEHLHRIYIGFINTSDTEIVEIDCKPITRWEVARPSIYPVGNALPASTGLPHETDVKVWENAAKASGIPAEYLWGSDDIIDSDTDYMITDLYWAWDQTGDSPLTTNPYLGEVVYLIVKTLGISDFVTVTFDSEYLKPNDMQEGVISETIKIPLTYNVGTGIGIGHYKIRTFEGDDMAFNNATWLNLTGKRGFNLDYTNDLNSAIQVNIGISAGDGNGFNRTSLIVDGVDVGGGRVDVSDGGGRTSMTLSAIVPSKSKYRLVQGSGVHIESWAELGRR